jgi:hypothetical protein
MANPIGDFMSNWLNSTYKYLKESGGGPTYPKVTVGPGVMPEGAYSTVEEYPITYGYVPRPFNPGATGIPATASSQVEAIEEVAKQNPPPTIFSKNFGLLYGDSMAACIADQKHRACNPNTENACRALAESGDSSGMSLMPNQKDALGIVPPSQENNKPDDVRLSEKEASLTGQIGTGAQNVASWVGLLANAGRSVKVDPSGNKTVAEDPAGINFQSLNDRLKEFIPGLPEIPGANTGSIVMIGGAVVLVVLLIAIVK